MYSIENIVTLKTFGANGTMDTFKGEARANGGLILLPGPGPLIVVGRDAFFQLFVIDPRVRHK